MFWYNKSIQDVMSISPPFLVMCYRIGVLRSNHNKGERLWIYLGWIFFGRHIDVSHHPELSAAGLLAAAALWAQTVCGELGRAT